MEKPSILVAVTHTGEIVTGLESKLSKWIYEYQGGAELHFASVNPTYANRNMVVEYFLNQTKHTHLLFIDSDTIPCESPLNMVDLGLDVVGGVYPMWKTDHYEWLAMQGFPDGHYETVPVEKRKGVTECSAVGSGCMMIKREVLMALKAPFLDKISENGTRALGHDYYFCQRAREAGFKIWADWDMICDHIKQVPLLTIVKALKRCYDEGYKNGLEEKTKTGIIN